MSMRAGGIQDINNPLGIQDTDSEQEPRFFEILGKDSTYNYPTTIPGVVDYRVLPQGDTTLLVLFGKKNEIIRYYNLRHVVWFGWASNE